MNTKLHAICNSQGRPLKLFVTAGRVSDYISARALLSSLPDVDWLEYFHVVFTLPAEIALIALWNKRAVYGLLFKASAETVMTIAADPKRLGAGAGMTSVLHTWGSVLTHHPHIHMIVPGGGLSPDGSQWIACKPGFFLHVRVLSRLFRRLFLEGLVALHRPGGLKFYGGLAGLADANAFAEWLAQFRKIDWVVYAKPPFGAPEAVLAYLSRYTHRVAISNHRLISADANAVAFRWKDYRIKPSDCQKVMHRGRQHDPQGPTYARNLSVSSIRRFGNLSGEAIAKPLERHKSLQRNRLSAMLIRPDDFGFCTWTKAQTKLAFSPSIIRSKSAIWPFLLCSIR